MSRYLTTSAITLDRQVRGEYDRLYTLYTATQGLVAAVAEGSAKVTSKLAGHLEPFGEVVVTFVQRGGSTKVTGAVSRRRWGHLSGNLAAWLAAGRCLRLTRMACGGTPDPGSFLLLREACAVLDAGAGGNPQAVALAFTLQLLARVGLQPQLGQCGRCRREVTSGGAFDHGNGYLRCKSCAPAAAPVQPPLSQEALELMRACATIPLQAAATRRAPATAFPEAAALLDQFVSYRLDAPPA